MASGKRPNWAWQHYKKLDSSNIQCRHCGKIYKSDGIKKEMKIHLRKDHQKFNDEDERKWIEQTEEIYSIWKHFTKQENYSAKCKICDTVVLHAYIVNNIQNHLKVKHLEVIREERKEVVENIWLSRHFVIDKNTDKAECKRIDCKKKFTIFLGIEYLRNHTYQHAMENITSHTNMGRNTIDMIQQSTSEENNANTSSYQAGTHSEVTENLEGERRSISANNGDKHLTQLGVEYEWEFDDSLL